MRKLFYLLIILFFAQIAFGANVYIGDLTENTSPDPTDYMEIDDGTNSEKAKLSNVITKSHGLSDGFPKIVSGIMTSVSEIDPDDILNDDDDDNLLDPEAIDTTELATSLSTDDLWTLSGVSTGNQHLGTFTGAVIDDNLTVKAAFQDLETYVESLGGGHDPVTLSADLNSNLLGLSTQELTLDSQSANTVFAGPTSGGAAAPSFRALVAADIPDISATYETQLVNEAGLYLALSDVSDFMQPGDTVQTGASTSRPGTCIIGQIYIDTDEDTDGEMYMCVATDTWKAVDNEGGSGDDEKVKVSSNETDSDYLVNQIVGGDVSINVAESGIGTEDLEITVDVAPSAGSATLIIEEDAVQVKYKAADFSEGADGLEIDYTNGQAAASGTKGFLTGTDWDTFNAKESETHASEHAVGGADSVFPGDPDANAIATWDDTAGQIDFGTSADLSYNGSAWSVVDDSHAHIYSNIDETTSSNWASVVSDETGSGAWVFGTDPTFTTNLNTPQITLTDQNASPNAVGEFNYDNTITGIDDGGLVWYDDDDVQIVVSISATDFAGGTGKDDYVLAYDENNTKWYLVAGGAGGGDTKFNQIADADADGTIQLLGFEQEITTTIDESGGVMLTLKHTDSDGLTNDTYLMEFIHANDGDTEAHFMRGLDNTSDELWKITYDGTIYAKAFMTTGTSTEPGFTFKDADNPGTDKEIAKIIAHTDEVNSGDGSEYGQMYLQAMINGTERTFIEFDGYTGTLKIGNQNAGENLIWDLNTGTANEASMTSDSGLDVLNFNSINIITDSYFGFTEMTAPGAGGANTIRLYAENEATSNFTLFKYVDSGGVERQIARDSVITVHNSTVSIIPVGTVVYHVGTATNGFADVAKARANSVTTMPAIGITIEEMSATGGATPYGRIMQVGLLEGVTTTGMTAGEPLYVSSTVAGEFSTTAPLAPNLRQELGSVILVGGAGVGKIQVVARSLSQNDTGTRQNGFSIGDGTVGAKTLTFAAGVDGILTWSPTSATKTITIPNASGTMMLTSDLDAAAIGLLSANLDDTDASIEWEDATALTDAGQLDTGAAVADTAFTDLTAGDSYTNYGDSGDDTIDELFDAIDTEFGNRVDKTPVFLDDSDVSADTITAAQCVIGTTITNDDAGASVDWDLPDCGSTAWVATVVAEEAQTIVLDSYSGDVITLIDGTALTAADAMDSDGNAGSMVVLECREANQIFVKAQVGVWVDGGVD